MRDFDGFLVPLNYVSQTFSNGAPYRVKQMAGLSRIGGFVFFFLCQVHFASVWLLGIPDKAKVKLPKSPVKSCWTFDAQLYNSKLREVGHKN